MDTPLTPESLRGEKPMNTKRPKQMTFRVSAEEYEIIIKKIAESGLNNQEYILRAVLNTTVQSNAELKELLPKLKRVNTELNRQGNNLNQIATILNQRGYVDYKNTLSQTLEAVQDAIEGVKEVWQSLRQYLRNAIQFSFVKVADFA